MQFHVKEAVSTKLGNDPPEVCESMSNTIILQGKAVKLANNTGSLIDMATRSPCLEKKISIEI